MIDAETYARERAICDKANAYAAQFRKPNGWTVLTAEEAAAPEYAACDNAMRGRVEQYEIATTKPERIFAYYRRTGSAVSVHTWTGDGLGGGDVFSEWRSNFGDRRASVRVVIAGAVYSGTLYLDAGDYCHLRKLKIR